MPILEISPLRKAFSKEKNNNNNNNNNNKQKQKQNKTSVKQMRLVLP